MSTRSRSDKEYITKSGNKGLYPMMYYNHNIHFLAAASAMKGRYADSIKSARELEANVKPRRKSDADARDVRAVPDSLAGALWRVGTKSLTNPNRSRR